MFLENYAFLHIVKPELDEPMQFFPIKIQTEMRIGKDC